MKPSYSCWLMPFFRSKKNKTFPCPPRRRLPREIAVEEAPRATGKGIDLLLPRGITGTRRRWGWNMLQPLDVQGFHGISWDFNIFLLIFVPDESYSLTTLVIFRRWSWTGAAFYLSKVGDETHWTKKAGGTSSPKKGHSNQAKWGKQHINHTWNRLQ